MLNSFKTRLAAVAAALLVIVFFIASMGLLPRGNTGKKPEKTFEISVDQGLGKKDNTRYEIKLKNELPYEASVSAVLVVIRGAELKADPDFPFKVEALPFPKAGEKVDPSYEVRLKPGQSQRFNVVFPKTVSQSPELLDLEIQIKAAAIDSDNRPYVVYTVRNPKVMKNET